MESTIIFLTCSRTFKNWPPPSRACRFCGRRRGESSGRPTQIPACLGVCPCGAFQGCVHRVQQVLGGMLTFVPMRVFCFTCPACNTATQAPRIGQTLVFALAGFSEVVSAQASTTIVYIPGARGQCPKTKTSRPLLNHVQCNQ